jgi:hypothetical protein
MTDHDDIRAQVITNTANINAMQSDISAVKVDVAVLRTNSTWQIQQLGEMKQVFHAAVERIEKRDAVVASDLANKEKQTWEKLSDVGVIKLIVFGATGIILSGFMMAIALLILDKLGLSV